MTNLFGCRYGHAAAQAGFSVPVLTQSALMSTVEDQIPDHAAALFETLEEVGVPAWRDVRPCSPGSSSPEAPTGRVGAL
ncbi:hypothetical protein [Streptomyces murinus]|uniref:hypothetical protein n=1 Tax=Streptomyces murinus TaxID=33900 RepID=UPI003F4569DE